MNPEARQPFDVSPELRKQTLDTLYQLRDQAATAKKNYEDTQAALKKLEAQMGPEDLTSQEKVA